MNANREIIFKRKWSNTRIPGDYSTCLAFLPYVPIKLIFLANQHFCWAHADSFLTLLNCWFWGTCWHTKILWEHCSYHKHQIRNYRIRI